MKVALVTGSNKGIGKAIVTKLAQILTPVENWSVYLTARNEQLGLEALKDFNETPVKVKFHQLDITDCKSVDNFVNYLSSTYGGVDILVNNAAIAFSNDCTLPFGEQAEKTMDPNFFSTLRLTQKMLPLMRENSRIVHVASTLGMRSLQSLGDDLYNTFINPMSIDELVDLMNNFVKLAKTNQHTNNGWPANSYGTSKLALMKMTFIFHEMLKNDPRKIVQNCCCPGYVNTDMTKHKGIKTVEEGADTPCYLATLPIGDPDIPNGKFVYERRVVEFTK